MLQRRVPLLGVILSLACADDAFCDCVKRSLIQRSSSRAVVLADTLGSTGGNPCPCLTTPAPTYEPGSIAWAEVEAAKDSKAVTAKADGELTKTGSGAAEHEIGKVEKAGTDKAGESAHNALEKRKEKDLGKILDKLQAEKDNKDQIMSDYDKAAREAALKNAAAITKAAEDLATAKAQVKIAKVMTGATEEAEATEARAEELRKEASESADVARRISEQALMSAHEAQLSALYYPKEAAEKATGQAKDAMDRALWVEKAQAQASQTVRLAMRVAEAARTVADEAVVKAEEARETAKQSLQKAKANSVKLIDLQRSANQALDAAGSAGDEAINAEKTMTAAKMAHLASQAVKPAIQE